MPFFSNTSKKKLSTCHEDLQLICNCAIHDNDFSVICGHRSENEQFALFTRGRKLENGVWIIDNRDEIVTYKDGINNKSEHNYFPSKAMDLVKWFKDKPHIRWNDKNSFFELNNVLQAHANFLYNTGKISHRLIWGGIWKMRDDGHWQLSKGVNYEKKMSGK